MAFENIFSTNRYIRALFARHLSNTTGACSRKDYTSNTSRTKSPFSTVDICERLGAIASLRQPFIGAGNVVHYERTYNEIPEANRISIESAAVGLGLPVDELRRRLRADAKEGLRRPVKLQRIMSKLGT